MPSTWSRLVPAGHGSAVLAGTLVLALLAAVRGLDPQPCVALREAAFDALQRLRPHQPREPVIVVAIDAASQRRHGPWPWSEPDIGRLREAAGREGARAIGLVVPGGAAIWPSDGRRVRLLDHAGDGSAPGLLLETLRATSDLALEVGSRHREIEIRLGAARLAIEADGQTRVQATPGLPARFVSAARLLEGGTPGLLRGRVALVAPLEACDRVTSPLGESLPAVEFQAQALEQLLEAAQGEPPLRRPWWASGVETGYGLLAGFACVLFTVRLRGRRNPLPPLLLLPLCAGVSVLAYLGPRLLLDPTFPMLAVLSPLPLVVALNQAAAERIRRRLEATLLQERADKARLEGELQAARKIQMGILPRQFPAFPGRRDFDLHALIEPARAVGGDLYDFFLIGEDRLFFMIGDVSGKGVPAALFMALTKALYKSSTLRRRGAIAEIMGEAGEELGRHNPEMMFVSVFAGILDLRTGELEYANAGHEPPLWLRPGRPPVRLPAGGGPPLCAVDDFPYAAERLSLAPGDSLLLFTDGVSEAQSRSGELFSAERILAAVQGVSPGDDPQQLVVRLHGAVQSFASDAEPADDITILAVRRNAPGAP